MPQNILAEENLRAKGEVSDWHTSDACQPQWMAQDRWEEQTGMFRAWVLTSWVIWELPVK